MVAIDAVANTGILGLPATITFFFFFLQKEVDSWGSSYVCSQFGFGTLDGIIQLLFYRMSLIEVFREGRAVFCTSS